MPPKAQPSKKATEQKAKKVVEDKTFGMKNKKGAQAQKYVQQIQKQITQKDPRELAKQKEAAKKKEKDELLDVTKLLKPVEQKAAKDVDPKSLLCVFFKQGLCQKGAKCKFSHDLQVEHKVVKKNLYVDSRDLKDDNKAEENMENWDEDKLKDVVDKKHSEENKRPNKTEIVCKYFIDAVENNKYGWFWECPNGGDKCIYRHCLPEGYILKRERKKMDEQKEDEITIEELVEKERAALTGKELTKCTLQTFVAWKKKKLKERKQKEAEELKAKKDRVKTGKSVGMSGRDLFIYDASNIQDDEEAGDVEFEKEEVDPDEKVFEIDANFFRFDGMDDELEEEMANSSTAVTSTAAGLANMAINTELFDVDEDIEGLDTSSDEEDENSKVD